MNIPSLSDAKDVTTILAGCIGGYVALVGLSTWKRQLRGQTDHELARRILVTLYKYREAIKGVRHPAMFGNETPEPPDSQRTNMSAAQIRYYGVAQAYQNRWIKVQEQRVELDAGLLESEAVWGIELKDKIFSDVFALGWELYIAVRDALILQDPTESAERKRVVQNMADARRDILYDSLEKEGDAFNKDLATAISKVERYLTPKLGRRQPKKWWPLFHLGILDSRPA